MSSSSNICTDVTAASEQLCYIHCNFCNIVLAVSVPSNRLFDTVTLRCENCTNSWPVNVGMVAALQQSFSSSIPSTVQDAHISHNQMVNSPVGRGVMSNSNKICIDVAPDSEQLCYIHCNFCNIVLAVSVPCSNLFDTVTVRCENCTNMWPVNVGMAAALQQSFAGASSTFQDSSSTHHQQGFNYTSPNYRVDFGFSSDCNNMIMPATMRPHTPLTNNGKEINNHPQEKRRRVPSLYNRFIKEEIQRIKANNPDINHKKAFSTAAKNWAHFPHMHIGLMFDREQPPPS